MEDQTSLVSLSLQAEGKTRQRYAGLPAAAAGARVRVTLLFFLCATGLLLLAGEQKLCSGSDCTFRQNPERIRTARQLSENQLYLRVKTFTRRAFATTAASASPDAPVPPTTHPHRNFIDSYLFGKLIDQGVPVARMTTDESSSGVSTWILRGDCQHHSK